MTTDQPALTSAVPAPRSAPAGDAGPGPGPAPRRGFLAKAFGITAVLSAAGSGLGLLRDLLLARYFGANQGTDAFLVAWTVPETAAPLLIEDAMSFLMVPAFALALVLREEHPDAPDPVRQLVRATLPWLLLALSGLALAVALGAPELVDLLAPGLADPGLAVACTRITAITVLPFGVAGYLAAALRAHHCFTAPAGIYVAYNLGILAVLLGCQSFLGVRSAALGVALGSLLMAGLLVGPFLRRLRRGATAGRARRSRKALVLMPLALLPVAAFTLTRQSQVFVERYLGSALPPGTISHLNYAAKVSQLAMTAGILICTVTFPLVARALAAGDLTAARDRVEKDLGQAAAVVLFGTAFLMACAPSVVSLLFQRGAFGPQDTAATAAVIRVYSFGLPAQALIGVIVRPYFSLRPVVRRADDPGTEDGGRRLLDWYPVAAMLLGLGVTVTVGLLATPRFGALGLAAGNAAGITAAAALLLHGLLLRGIPLRLRRVLGGHGRLAAAAAGATVLGAAAAGLAADPLLSTLLGGLTVALAFAALGTGLGAREVRGPVLAAARALNPPTVADEGKLPHGQ
ncbi:putative peptidoglycan lipid II flippase [Kitasatospora sp. MAA19]|uniref:lipid II flippase MurJ n=1 Tax=Kitasatospora sp. MAA19 TaxID=3035090 RepID=UPI002475EEE9|nr:lipid II flippase MurJ [Kitasatospora sp. MAA19]MDH6706187.1 putative peptidoglycan lipid II flippase [Kitasatospora sp. MAA19]